MLYTRDEIVDIIFASTPMAVGQIMTDIKKQYKSLPDDEFIDKVNSSKMPFKIERTIQGRYVISFN